MELARLKDEDGDTHSVLETSIGSHVIRVGHSDDDMSEAYRIEARDALRLIDAAGANTTANALSTELTASRERLDNFRRWLQLAGCGAGQIARIETRNDIEIDYELPRETGRELDLIAVRNELAAANETIAQLRQRDTVRPEVDAAQVWDEGYKSGSVEATNFGTVERNPYR